MKITIDKNITIGDAALARKILEEYKKGDSMETLGAEEMKRAGAFYIDGYDVKIYEASAQIAYHSGGIGLLSEEENFSTRYPLDIYIEMFVRGSEACGEVGFYLSDFWQSTGDNDDELRSKAYIKLFKSDR